MWSHLTGRSVQEVEKEIADLRAKVAELRALQKQSYSYSVAGKIKSLLWQWHALTEELERLNE